MRKKNKVICCLCLLLISVLLVALAACEKSCKHTFSSEVVTDPTCTTDGLTVHSCMSCNFTYEEVTSATGQHQPGTPTEENRVEPTCVNGSYDRVVNCTICDTEIERTSIVIPSVNKNHVVADGACINCGLPESSDGLVFELNSDGKSYTLVDIGTCTETDIVIGLYNDLPVTVIGMLAFYKDDISTVAINDCVLKIRSGAFSGCEKLTSVSIGRGVKEIETDAFVDSLGICELVVSQYNIVYKSVDNNLYSKDGKTLLWYAPGRKDTSFTVPDGVTEIGERAFWRIPRLVDVTIPEGVTVIGEQAFYECPAIESVAIPDTVLEMEYGAFCKCTSLKSVVIPGGSVGGCAFYGCSSLSSVTVADGVTSFGNDAFSACTSLAEITIPATLTTLGDCPFYGCTSLADINVDNNNPAYKSVDGNLYTKDGKTLIQYAIAKTDTQFTIPDGVEVIAGLAFYGCTAIEQINIPVGVTCIDRTAFGRCTSLKTVTIPESVESIGGGAFYGCTSLESIVIPNSVTNLGEAVFYGCNLLKSVVIGDGVTLIKSDTFYNCVSLTDVVIGNGVTEIGEWAFYKCESLKNLTLGNNIVIIGYAAFYYCTSLESLIIPDAVTTIEDGAFLCCTSLENVILPASIKTLGLSSFADIPNLTTIKYRGTEEQWNEIEQDSKYTWNYDLSEYEIIFNYTEET